MCNTNDVGLIIFIRRTQGECFQGSRSTLGPEGGGRPWPLLARGIGDTQELEDRFPQKGLGCMTLIHPVELGSELMMIHEVDNCSECSTVFYN